MLRLRLENLALAAFETPLERLRPLLPSRLELDRAPAGQAVIAALFCEVRRRSPVTAHRRRALTVAVYTVCVRRDAVAGFYVLRSLVAPHAVGAVLGTLLPAVGPASRRRDTAVPPGAGAPDRPGLISYSLEAGSGSLQVSLAPSADQGRPGEKNLLDFVTNRQRCHFWIRGRYLWWTPISLSAALFRPAEALRVRLPMLQELGILSAAEVSQPGAAFLVDSLAFRCGFPRPDLLL